MDAKQRMWIFGGSGDGRGPKIKAKKSCVRVLFFCCEMSGTKSVGRSIPLRSGCAQVGLFFTMICTTLTSRTCFYFLGWCFRRASLDQFCQHLGEFSWLTGMHQRFDINCFWKSQDAWQTSEFATAICFFNITSLCELSEDVFCWSKAVRPRRGKRWKPAIRLTRGASTPLSWTRSSGCGFLVVLVAQARALRLSLGCVCVFVCVLKILAGVTRGMLKNQCSRKIKAVVIADRCNLVFRLVALFWHPGHACRA